VEGKERKEEMKARKSENNWLDFLLEKLLR
jgi:hypothetical protein